MWVVLDFRISTIFGFDQFLRKIKLNFSFSPCKAQKTLTLIENAFLFEHKCWYSKQRIFYSQ